LANTFALAWGNQIAPPLSVSCSLQTVEVTDLNSNTGAQVVVSSTAAGSHSGGTDLPASNAMIVKFKIGTRYRGGHPRWYQCGWRSDQTSNTVKWSPSVLSAFITSWISFIQACELSPPSAVGTLTHVNVSYFSGFANKTFPSGRTRAVPTPRVTPVVSAVIAYSGNPNIASQRRRNLQSV
jgi:hypothetical protein